MPGAGLGSIHGVSASVAHLSQAICQGADALSLRSMVYLTAPAEPRQATRPIPEGDDGGVRDGVRRHRQASDFESMGAQELGAGSHVVHRHDDGRDAAVIDRPPLAAFIAERVFLVRHVGGNGLPAEFIVVGLECPEKVAQIGSLTDKQFQIIEEQPDRVPAKRGFR